MVDLETRTAVDNLGEEIANDINSLEQSLKQHNEQFEKVQNTLQAIHSELKMTQVNSVAATK